MNMKMKAIVSSPRDGIWQVAFYYVEGGGRVDHTLPVIHIPCSSYEQAQITMDSYNNADHAADDKE